MGPADRAWERQLLAGQQELQMAARLCAYFATAGARTNEENHPRPFRFSLKSFLNFPGWARAVGVGKDRNKKSISLSVRGREKDEGGITRVKSALCQKPVRSPTWISEYDRERKTRHIKSSHAWKLQHKIIPTQMPNLNCDERETLLSWRLG